MPPKRKRESSPPASSKKAKTIGKSRGRPRKSTQAKPSTSRSLTKHPHGNVDSEQLYKVRSIIDEDSKRYKIDWEDGSDGEKYEPTWEPKENANELAVEEWEQTKAERKQRKSAVNTGTPVTFDSEVPSSEPPTKKRGRPKRRPVSESPAQGSTKIRTGRTRKQGSYQTSLGRESVEQSPERSIAHSLQQEQDDQEGDESVVEGAAPETLEIQDSYPEQQHFAADQLGLNPQSRPDTLYRNHPFKTHSARSPEVRITPHPEIHGLHDEDSVFPSSQVISGTQTHKSPSPDSSQPVDAAAAQNLTQKHSQYEPEDTSRSDEDNTCSVVINSSSSVHTFATTHQFPAGAIIPDSQSINDSISWIPSQNKSGESDNTTQSQDPTQHAAQAEEISHLNSQVVPESSVPKGTQPPDVDNALRDTTTPPPQVDDFSNYINQFPSPVEAVVEQEEALESVTSPVSPAAARTSSSTSSPPPTDSPAKTQSQSQSQSQSLSRSQSQSQHLHAQIDSGKQSSVEQAAQRPETIDLDETRSAIAEEVETAESHRGLFEGDHNTTESAKVPLSGPEKPPSSQLQDTGSSIRFNTQVPLASEKSTLNVFAGRKSSPSPFISQPLAPHVETISSIREISDYQALEGSRQKRPLTPGVILSSLPVSSQFPSAPSQDLGPIGESAPPLPANLTDIVRTPASEPRALSMESSASTSKLRGGKANYKDRVAAARAARKSAITSTPRSSAPVSPKPASAVPARLQSPALQDREARSPSMIPAIEAPVKEAPEEYFRSERYETLLPGDELDLQTTFESLETAPKAVNLHSIRYVPINFGEQQRDHYRQTLRYHKELIEKFRSTLWPADSSIADRARLMVQELRNIVLHPDLNNEEIYTQPSQVDPEFKAQWDVDSSSKFRFLKHYLLAAHDYNFHTVLLVKHGRSVSMLQTFLQGLKIDFRIAPNVGGGAKPAITILSPGFETVGIHTPDLILSMQGEIPDTYTAEIQKLLQIDAAIPALSLIVPRTVEHIERAMPDNVSEAERLHVLMGTIFIHRSEAGRERDNSNTAEVAASRLVNFMLSPLEWPFEELPEVRLVEPVSPSQASTESRIEDSNGSTHKDDGHGLKRPLGDGVEEQQETKKARVQLSDEMIIDASHVSDSVASQQAAAIKVLKDEFAQKERDMDAALRKSQAQLDEHVKALSSLQYRHEEQRQQLVQAESERNKAVEAAAVATLRITTLQTSVADLRTERSDLQNQLREAKEAAVNHTIPERAEFEMLKEAAAAATAERTKLLNKVKSAEDQLEYIRDQYQTASNQASTLGKANATLEAQVVEFRRKASGEQSKVRAMFLDTQSKNLMTRNKQLESILKGHEEALQRKEEENTRLKESGRGRMNTRQSSVPRTPRIGSPLAQGSASRQGSPAAGRLPHPLRNAR